MGGAPIFSGARFSLVLWLDVSSGVEQYYLFSALTIFFIIGLRDDIIPMRPRFKLLSQLIPVLMVVILSDIKLVSLYSLIDIEFNPVVSILISVFTLIVITNSFNLIDGIDGLSGTIGGIILFTFGSWFYLTDHFNLSYICFAFFGGLIAFLIYNWSPSKIFMGDTGALLLGFLIGCFCMYFIDYNFRLPSGSEFKVQGSISSAVCILIIPLVDTLRVFILRVIKGHSPLEADNNHIHHAFISLGFSHASTTLILGTINCLFILIAYLGRDLNDRLMLLTICGLVSLLLSALSFFSKRKPQT